MNISVIGIWHLGSVTAACLADFGHNITCIDENKETIKNLKDGILPIYEPGLKNLTQKYNKAGTLKYSDNFKNISNSDIVWITYDTPVDKNDIADVEYVIKKINKAITFMKSNSTLIISSQLPIGTSQLVKSKNKKLISENSINLVCIPENLRLGNSIKIFNNPDRIIVGIDSIKSKQLITKIYKNISERIIWMSIASAEMTKHAINSFLACSVVFINELSSICELTGADANEVELGLKSEKRIGPHAYLKPGNAFAGGTLARDISFLINKGKELNFDPLLFKAVLNSNNKHKNWIRNKISFISKSNNIKNISVLGLTYKPGTNTLRRSLSIELCNWLLKNNYKLKVHDPQINYKPSEIDGSYEIYYDLDEKIFQTQILIISNECKEFLDLNFDEIYKKNPNLIVIDPNSFLLKSKNKSVNKFKYYNIGKSV